MIKNYPLEVNNNIELLIAPYKHNIQPEEKEWIEQALSDIKNSGASIHIEDRTSRHLDALGSFTPDQIVRLVNILQQAIKQESCDGQIESQICQKLASSSFQINIPIDRLIRESADINFAIKVTVQRVKQGKLDSLKAAECLHQCGLASDTLEIQGALIEIAKLAAQQNGRGTSEYIKNYGIDASKSELTQFVFSCIVKQFGSFKYSNFTIIFEAYSKVCNGNGIETYHLDMHQFDVPLNLLKAGDLPRAFQESLGIATALFEMSKDQLFWVHDRVSSIKENAEQNKVVRDDFERDIMVKAEQAEFLEQWMSLCALCASREDLKQLFKLNGLLFEKLFQLSPTLRIRMMQEVVSSSLDPKSLFVDRLKAELAKKPSVVDKIAVLPRDLSIAVTEIFLRGCHDSQSDRVMHLRESVSDVVHAQIVCFILGDYPVQGADVYLKVVAAIVKDRNFRDAKYQQLLLAALVAIEKSSLQDAKKLKLLQDIFTIKDTHERFQSLKLITDILNFKGESYLGETIDLAALKSTLERLFVDKCKVKLDNFGALYQDTVGKWRSKDALLTYAGKHVGNPRALPYFQRFLTAVLHGNFSQNRYAVENNPHLDFIKKSHPKVFEAWQKPVSLTAVEIASKDNIKEIPVEIRLVENLKQAVENRHLGLEQQETLFPVLSACIGKWDALDEPLKHIKKDLELLSNRPLTREKNQQKQRLQLQKLLLELVKDPKDVENKLNVLKAIKIKGFETILGPFYQDLEDAVKMLRSSQKPSPDEMTMIDSDDPNHFLLMGTEVLNSCQNVNGSASLNVGLLGYALDGKHRLALVCDSSGKVLARSVQRLLIDAKGNPVLFQERVYVADASPEYPLLLRKIALKKAELLGIPLVVSPSDFEKEQAQPYAFAIEARDKPVPFEYVDALAGLQSGAYKIVGSLRVDPKT